MGGVLGAGKLLLSTTAAAVTIVVLTVYFLSRAYLRSQSSGSGSVPASRRDRVGLLVEEVFGRVGRLRARELDHLGCSRAWAQRCG